MKSVLVTGGTIRLGKVISEFLANRDWRVVTSSHREDAKADILADLSRPNAAEKLYRDTCDFLGEPPNAIVNNAALYRGTRDELLAINLTAPLALSRLMRDVPFASVVSILDSRLLFAPSRCDYDETKIRLRDSIRELAIELAGRVRVNAVAPGPVIAPVAIREKAAFTPFGRPTPEDVASAVSFLLSSPHTTGCIIPVDGGASVLSS